MGFGLGSKLGLRDQIRARAVVRSRALETVPSSCSRVTSERRHLVAAVTLALRTSPSPIIMAASPSSSPAPALAIHIYEAQLGRTSPCDLAAQIAAPIAARPDCDLALLHHENAGGGLALLHDELARRVLALDETFEQPFLLALTEAARDLTNHGQQLQQSPG
eukprot:scaffold23090_cov65-Phaeocystis_antarctica.AAC.22